MRRIVRFLALVLILALLGVGGSLVWVDRFVNTPHQHGAESEYVMIDQGMGRKAIINRLVEKGVIGKSFPVLAYTVLRPELGKLQAGEYRFESPITPIQVLDKIHRGLVATEQVTIPEGFDKFDVIEILVASKIDSREAIEDAVNDTSLISDIDPQARDLEGYLFPDTYTYTRQTRSPQLVAAMVRRTRQMLTPERIEGARARGISVRQLMTMASLVEMEAKVDDERPLIASVFYNRIERNMTLGCDPTFIYAAKLAGVWDNNVNNPIHRRRESPYNTYVSPGLPPGPITSPGVKSIEAALNPADTDYIFFVVNGSEGRHKFSRTEAEHLAAVAEYRRQQQQSN